MPSENKITFWGVLDIAARTMEEIPERFQALYDRGEHRMRPEDVVRMANYLKRIHAAELKIKSTLSQFKALNK